MALLPFGTCLKAQCTWTRSCHAHGSAGMVGYGGLWEDQDKSSLILTYLIDPGSGGAPGLHHFYLTFTLRVVPWV